MMSQWLIQYLSVDVVDGRVAAELVVERVVADVGAELDEDEAVDVGTELVVEAELDKDETVDVAAVLSVDRLLLAVDIEVLGLVVVVESSVVDGSVPLLRKTYNEANRYYNVASF